MRVSHWKAGSDILCDYVVVDIRNSWIDVVDIMGRFNKLDIWPVINLSFAMAH